MNRDGKSIINIHTQMRLSDIELMVQALEIETVEKEEVIETTLDKAFPFLFG